MIVLGIHNTGVSSSAAVVVDGDLQFGCCEERLDRRKYSKYFPWQSINACLDWIGASLDDVGVFAIGWNPAINIGSRFRAGFSEWPGYPGARFYSNPNQLLPRMHFDEHRATEQIFQGNNSQVKITYVSHHLAHCANAFYLSGFDRAAIFSSDGYGERATNVWAVGDGNDITVLRQIDFPHSIGLFYSTITEFLGFRPDLDEWKVMGAAAYGDPARYRDAVAKLLQYGEDAELLLDLKYFDYFNFDTQGHSSPRLASLLGPPRADEPLTQRHYDIAAAAQEAVENYLFAAVRWLRLQSGSRRICLSGGVIMNSVFNGKLAQSGLFDDVFIPYAPDDSGNSIGAALLIARGGGEAGSAPANRSPYLGRAYSDDVIEDTLKRYRLKATRLANVPSEAAKFIADGKIVGWFQGRMEFGQRALGCRSILADPRDASMKDRINAAVKYREAFRPFAPAIMAEAAPEYFEGKGPISAPYMEKVFTVRSDKRDKIPAVVHADGSGRLQTVERTMNPLFYDTLAEFRALTDIPVLLNTSFNLNNEPIVEAPADAIRTFYTSGLDALVLGSYLMVKEQ